MFNSNAQRNTILMIIIVLCTLTIISTNYMFTQSMVTQINDSIMENEYKKIGGKENYIILQEIQKREILSYLDNIKNEKPGLIKEIFEKQNNNNSNLLDPSIIDDLKKDTYIKGNTGAVISVIEFSDMECTFCKSQHTSGVYNNILEKNDDKVNYIFKNFPLPTHKNAQKEAEASKCVENIAGGEKYLEYIGKIFTETKSGGEGYKIENLSTLAENMGVDKIKFNECFNNGMTKIQVEREFVQGRMLGIKSVPASLILNNMTGKYKIISEELDEKTLENMINEIIK
ncbi:MAG: thioredoxin domain-containing protein [Candidatus Gracilibacteria bacterium]|nr:thioredoxin domain-containing protein [Candidatus Gracilibacteria bacterium]